jgi:hypothetical protein
MSDALSAVMSPMQFNERELSDIDAALCLAADIYKDEASAADARGERWLARQQRAEESRIRALMEKIGSRKCAPAGK